MLCFAAFAINKLALAIKMIKRKKLEIEVFTC